jgi:two-component system response regulator HydG
MTICLLDDDPSVLKATGRLVASAGWKVETFTDPTEFLRYALENQPAVAVIDILMPIMNGLEVQARLRSVSPTTGVIILTSKDDPSVRNQAVNAGAVGFFLKPANDCELLAAIETAMFGKFH